MSNILHRLFNPEDISSAIWPQGFISSVFGQWNSVSKTLSILYGIIMTVIHFLLTLTVSYEDMIANTIGDKPFNGRVFIAWLDFSINFILLPVHVWSWIIVGQSSYRLAVTSLTIIDKDLSKIPICKVNFITTVKRQFISLIGFILIYIILVINFSYTEEFRFRVVCHMFVILYPLMIRISTCLNFANVVIFIGERYELVNQALTFFGSSNSLRTVKRSQACDDDDDDDGKSSSSSSFINKLRIIHASFIAGITDIYQIYLSLTSPCYEPTFSQISNHFIETFIDFGSIIYVAYYCHKTMQKANETTQIINSTVVNTEGLYYEASTFSHQLMHYRLCFSPFGLFQLDLISQHSMAATVSLYLIIFVQLQPSYVEYECSKNV